MSFENGTNASVPLTEEQKAKAARLLVMRQMMRALVDSEDRKHRGLAAGEIPSSSVAGVSMKKVLDDLVELKYAVCTTDTFDEEADGDLKVRKLCERYATTFFGRKWLLEQEM